MFLVSKTSIMTLTTNEDKKQTKNLKSHLVQTCKNIPQNTVIGRIPHIGKGIFMSHV